MKHIVFLCPHNALRSVIAASLFNQMAAGRADAESAGTEPAERVNERTIQVLREVGIEVADQIPQHVSRAMLERADRVVTLACPLDPELAAAAAGKFEDWPMPDTAGKPVEAVREVRELVRVRVEQLIAELASAPDTLVSGATMASDSVIPLPVQATFDPGTPESERRNKEYA